MKRITAVLAVGGILGSAALGVSSHAVARAGMANDPVGSISGRVMVATPFGKYPYAGGATVACQGPNPSTVISKLKTGRYSCSAVNQQQYKVFAKGTSSYTAGGRTAVATASNVDVDLVPIDSGLVVVDFSDKTEEERVLLCEAAQWAEHAYSIAIACSPPQQPNSDSLDTPGP